MGIESILDYHFKNKRLLEEALTHPGCAKMHKGLPQNYQRLEFLGDSVLGMVVADILYGLYPLENEGNLAKRHAALVRGESLAQIARELGLGEFMQVAPGGDAIGRENASNLEDMCEALIGALYLDGGIEAARAFIKTHWLPLARNVLAAPKDAKTSLQEWAQGRGLPLPAYTVVETVGLAHAPEFTIEVSVQAEDAMATAKATSKRQAEQLAAAELLAKLEARE